MVNQMTVQRTLDNSLVSFGLSLPASYWSLRTLYASSQNRNHEGQLRMAWGGCEQITLSTAQVDGMNEGCNESFGPVLGLKHKRFHARLPDEHRRRGAVGTIFKMSDFDDFLIIGRVKRDEIEVGILQFIGVVIGSVLLSKRDAWHGFRIDRIRVYLCQVESIYSRWLLDHHPFDSVVRDAELIGGLHIRTCRNRKRE